MSWGEKMIMRIEIGLIFFHCSFLSYFIAEGVRTL